MSVAADAGPLDPSEPADHSQPVGPTRAEQLKTILAAVGAVALLFHGLRLLGAAQRS